MTPVLRNSHYFNPRSSATFETPSSLRSTVFTQNRSLAQVQSNREILPDIWFTSSSPPRRHSAECGHKPEAGGPDERTLKLGKSRWCVSCKSKSQMLMFAPLIALRILQTRLPTLLASPLPQDILSPHISLHLFPSTHPHLPTVSGRVAYHAALWTAPVAWGRVPIVGNVKLIILSERVVKNGPHSNRGSSRVGSERLIVRWKTCGKTKGKGMDALYRGIGASEQVDKITEWLGGDARDDEKFCGLFIFEFDEEGRILTHTIEHAEEEGSADRASKVISVTDWLLGRAKWKPGHETPNLALEYSQHGQRRMHVR